MADKRLRTLERAAACDPSDKRGMQMARLRVGLCVLCAERPVWAGGAGDVPAQTCCCEPCSQSLGTNDGGRCDDCPFLEDYRAWVAEGKRQEERRLRAIGSAGWADSCRPNREKFPGVIG